MRKMYKLRFQTKRYRVAQAGGAGACTGKKSRELPFWKNRDVLTKRRRNGPCAGRNADADTTGHR